MIQLFYSTDITLISHQQNFILIFFFKDKLYKTTH